MLARVWFDVRARWQRETSKSVNRGIAGGAAVTALVSFVPRGLGFAREALVAAFFGLSGHLEAYLVALMLVGIPSAIVSGPLQSALIPALVNADADVVAGDAGRLLRGAVSVALAGITVFLLILPGIPDVIRFVAGGWPVEKQVWAVSLVYVLIPYYLLSSVNLLGYGALQARKRFFENAFLPSVVPLTMMVLLIANKIESAWILAAGMSLGTAVEFALLATVLWRCDRLALFPGRISTDDRYLVPALRQFVVLVPGTLVMALMPVIDQTLASRLGDGAVAALRYGYRIPAFISSILVTALSTAALPFISQLAAKYDYSGIRHTLWRWSTVLVVAGTALSLGLIALSTWFVEIVFQHGAFDAHATTVVSEIQRMYLLQLPGMLVGILVTRTVLAIGAATTLTVVTVGSVVLYAVAAWVLVQWIGIAGIPLTAAIVSTTNAVVLLMLAHRVVRSRSRELSSHNEKSLPF